MKKFFLIYLLLFSYLNAHALKIFASQENGEVQIYTYFTKSSPCKNCQVDLLDENSQIFETGVSDENGKISFFTKKPSFKIVVNASAGHLAQIQFSSDTPIEEEKTSVFLKKILLSLSVIIGFFVIVKVLKRRSY
jgi:hypothetical protein